MAIITYPLNGIEYLAEDAETYLCTRTSGVYSADGNFSATAEGNSRQILVSPGLAWINNTAYAGKSILNNGTISLETDIADGALSRIDRIVLRFDKGKNGSEIVIKKGVPGSKPVPPEITRSELIYELGLYTVNIKAGSTVITQADITNTMLDETVCGVMRDGVTGIPTEELQKQAEGMVHNVGQTADTAIKDITQKANDKISEIDQSLTDFENGKTTEFNEWFAGIKDILDQDTAGNLLNLINQKASTATYTATLTAGGWSSSAPYTQTVSVAEILHTDDPITGVILPDDKESMEVQREAWFCVSKIDTADGSIKATCLEEKPAVSLNIQMKVVR